MFSRVSVILSTEGGVCGGGRGGMTGAHSRGGHVWWGGHVWQRGGVHVAGETTTAADGAHPTVMHSCHFYVCLYVL